MNAGAAQTIVEFVNTLNVETAEDSLDDPSWTASERRDLRRLREALRAELLAHHDDRSDERAGQVIDEVVSRYALGTNSADGTVRLVSNRAGAGAIVARVVDAMLALLHVGQWMRVRACPADDCREAFYDSSRGGTRRWCDMGVCGNRSKVRTYRDRSAGS